ncbi:MAG: hypothetical protein AAF495_03090 [Pseudomonadota bacterium]
MTVIDFPSSGLSEQDLQALKSEGYRRLEQGLAGHVARGRDETGQTWAAILRNPSGPPLHYFWRDQGVYYVLHVARSGKSRLVDAHRDFTEILRRLPDEPPAVLDS